MRKPLTSQFMGSRGTAALPMTSGVEAVEKVPKSL